VPKPWTRIGPALLQNPELLQHVTELDYRLDDPAFVEYLRRRGVIHVLPKEGSPRHRYFAKHSLTRGDFVTQCVAEGEPAYATPQDIESGWRIIQLGRAALQDAWEAFIVERVEQPVAADPVTAPPKAKRSTPPRRAAPKSKAPPKGKKKDHGHEGGGEGTEPTRPLRRSGPEAPIETAYPRREE
jgi:hypothetical protein